MRGRRAGIVLSDAVRAALTTVRGDRDMRLASRSLSTRVDERRHGRAAGGQWLTPEVGAVLLRALEAARSRCRRPPGGRRSGPRSRSAGPMRWGSVAESALAGKLDYRATHRWMIRRFQVTVHVLDLWALKPRMRGRAALALRRRPTLMFEREEDAQRVLRVLPLPAPDVSPRRNARRQPGSREGASRRPAWCRRNRTGGWLTSTRPAGPLRLLRVTGNARSRVASAAGGTPVAEMADVPMPDTGTGMLDGSWPGTRLHLESCADCPARSESTPRSRCGSSARPDLWEPWAGNRPGPPSRPQAARQPRSPRPRQRAPTPAWRSSSQPPRAASPAMPASWCCATPPTARSSTAAAEPASSRPPCAAPSRAGIATSVSSPAATAAAGQFRFLRPDGEPLPAVPPAARWQGAPLAPTVARLAAAGITIGPDTATPEWYGESLDVAAALEVLWEPPAAVARGGP